MLYAMYGLNFMFCSNANSICLEFFFIHNETVSIYLSYLVSRLVFFLCFKWKWAVCCQPKWASCDRMPQFHWPHKKSTYSSWSLGCSEQQKEGCLLPGFEPQRFCHSSECSSRSHCHDTRYYVYYLNAIYELGKHVHRKAMLINS